MNNTEAEIEAKFKGNVRRNVTGLKKLTQTIRTDKLYNHFTFF